MVATCQGREPVCFPEHFLSSFLSWHEIMCASVWESDTAPHTIAVLVLIFNSLHSLAATGETQVCHFYNLNADCRYHIDRISLSHVTASIQQCTDPIQVTFNIQNERPVVSWSHVYSSSDSQASVPGFDVDVQLQVRLRWKEKQVLNVEADFYVKGRGKTDFVHDDIKLSGLTEHCVTLNKASKIAIGVMGGLLVIALTLTIILIVVHRQRKLAQCSGSNAELVVHSEMPECTDSHHQSSLESARN